ncbi:hypothetical protein EKO04_002345 [Ascochyta lentis]|uniref:Uncharacterized protein n=1 Tax=Ascochyta lentis TaxID=205686 RepID=A0A8H7JBE1_9PLEO|nr:hypothetical protein EKO04_002345 [Ascochyta lentis]
MRFSLLRNSALLSLLGLSSAQSTSSWGEPFNVDVSTESLLPSSQQALTNLVGTNTPATTGLAPLVPITGAFSTTIPTELASASTSAPTGVVTVSSSVTGSAASSRASASAASSSASASASAASSRASSSGSGAATQSTAAAAPVGIQGQQKMMGVAGALAGAAGVLFI